MGEHLERLDPGTLPADPEAWWECVAHLWRYYYAAAQWPLGRVVDAACGLGYGTEILRQAGHWAVGYDRDSHAVAQAMMTYPLVLFYQADLDHEAITLDGFDTLVCFETLEHLKDPESFLARLSPTVTTLLCSVPVVPNVDPYNPFHYHEFTIDSFGGLLDTAGFTVLDTQLQSSPWRRNLISVVKARRA